MKIGPFPRQMGSWLFGGLTALSLLVFLCLIWFPELRHYYVPGQTITVAMTDRGRTVPSDDVLQEMRSHRMLELNWQSDAQLIEKAEKLLKGSAEVPGFPAIHVQLPFDPADLERGTGLWQLQFSGLVVPEIFIDAYRLTGREEFFEKAREVILGWAKYERSSWLNRGFLWNDHAVAARVRTLADFWSIYRHRRDYRSDIAQQIWGFAARTGALLAKPDQFTVATNHGVMQNIGLLQTCSAFPSLPLTEAHKQIALSRLKEQISFYVSPEGVILEHSAGYQKFGLSLFGLVLRYATILNLEVPSEWARKYEQAKQFYMEIRRPDGSLPTFGDTGIGRDRSTVPVTQLDSQGRFGPLTVANTEFHPVAAVLYPVSGYAVLWDGLNSQSPLQDFSQTVLAWSNYPGHGHKHADEPSVLFWARGQEWWTNAGYWPYGDPDRSHAECWEGSNAPHLLGEKCSSDRTATLVSAWHSSGLFAAEVERQGPEGLKIRRLLLHAAPATWVIVDECKSAARNTLQTIWTTAPNVRLQRGAPPGSYTFSADEAKGQLRAYFLGPPALTIRNFWGSRDPFAGWISLDGRPAAANAVATSQPAEGAWAVTVWVLDKDSRVRAMENTSATVEWNDVHSWKVHVPIETDVQLISRDGQRITVDAIFSHTSMRLPIAGTLEPMPPAAESQRATLLASYQAAAAHYPRYRDLTTYRIRASAIGIVLFVLQELFLAIYGRVSRKYLLTLRILVLVGWFSLCVWVPFFYLDIS